MPHYIQAIYKEKARPLLWLLSWGIVAFGQPSWNPILPLIAATCGYALFWFSLSKVQGKKQRFVHGCLWFMCVQAIQLSWMTATAYHGWYILLVYLTVLLWFGVQFGILTMWLSWDLRISVLRAFAVAGLWVLMEWSRLFVFCGFPFNMSGIALGGWIVSAQWVAVCGIFGLSFLVIFINIMGLNFLNNSTRNHLWIYMGSIAGVVIFGAVHLACHAYKMELDRSSYQVALIQTGLKPEEKVPLNGKKHLFVSPFDQWMRVLAYLKERHTERFDLIVLPEAAMPYGAHREVYPIEDVRWIFEQMWGKGCSDFFPDRDGQTECVSNAFWAQTIANYYQSELIIGLDDYDAEENKSYNAAFHFFPNKTSQNRYEKCILVPLAEYLPIKFLQPLVSKYGIFDFATHGAGAKVFGKNIPTAISICYEECFGQFIRQGKLKGAQLLVNVTNDGWYLPSKLPEQHFYHGRLRSIENGVPLVRACNTGITAAVDSVGRICAYLPKKERDTIVQKALVTSLPLYHYSTLYTLYGDAPIIMLSIISVLVFAGSRRFLLTKEIIASGSGQQSE